MRSHQLKYYAYGVLRRRLIEVSVGTLALAVGISLTGYAISLSQDRGREALPNPETPVAVGAVQDLEAPDASDAPDDGRLDRPPVIASYTLEAALDPEAHTVDGEGVLTWTNTSRKPVTELWFHLYLNAFKNDQTHFLRDVHSKGEDKKGGIEVESLSVREFGDSFGDANLWKKAAKHSPGDLNDETDIRVPLPRPVEPGETITIDMVWQSRLPEGIARTGHGKKPNTTFHMVGQWFPKIALLEADGKWEHFRFDRNAEFYADYGDYDVTIDVPAGFTVGASGVLQDSTENKPENKTDEGNRRKDRFVAKDVHDFGWTAWDGFEERNAIIDGVAVRMLYPPGHERNAERTEESLRLALPRFGELYGRYPYPNLTTVHPPAGADAASGMEYPTLITTGGPWYSGYTSRAVEAVTVHELGHQWFYGLLASNEERWPFLDEGLNTYAELDAMELGYGDGTLLNWPWLQISLEAFHRAGAAHAAHDEPVAQPASAFSSRRTLASLAYARTGTVFRTLANVYGHGALERALRAYSLDNRFKHPGPDALFAAVEEELGAGAAEVAREALFERGWVDFEVESVSATKRPEPVDAGAGAGAETDAGANAGVPETDAGTGGAGAETDGAGAGTGGTETGGAGAGTDEVDAGTVAQRPPYIGRAVIRRKGPLAIPVEVEFVAEDGTKERVTWDAQKPWVTLDYEGESPLVSVVVDPDRNVTLDQNLLNNAKSVSRRTASRVMERLTYWTELWLTGLGS